MYYYLGSLLHPKTAQGLRHRYSGIKSILKGEIPALEIVLHLAGDLKMNFRIHCICLYNSEPVQYIIGEWDFHELTLMIRPPILVPRPETEVRSE